MRPFLVTSDLHLTDRPDDAYRFRLWDAGGFLESTVQEHRCETVYILGDLTDAKDHHSARLVNTIVDTLAAFHARTGAAIKILRGNHDGTDPGLPFFRFLEHLPPWLEFFAGAGVAEDGEVLLIPHQRDPAEFTRLLEFGVGTGVPWLVLAHQTFRGAIAENGSALDGIVRPAVPVVSGDVHVPQELGTVLYVGAPYAVRYRDTFVPRVLVVRGGWNQAVDYHSVPVVPRMRRPVLEVRELAELEQADTEGAVGVKVRVLLWRSQFGGWAEFARGVRSWAAGRGLPLVGPELVELRRARLGAKQPPVPAPTTSPPELLRKWAGERGVEQAILAVGEEILAGPR